LTHQPIPVSIRVTKESKMNWKRAEEMAVAVWFFGTWGGLYVYFMITTILETL